MMIHTNEMLNKVFMFIFVIFQLITSLFVKLLLIVHI